MSEIMRPTPCQMQIIKRNLPQVNVTECEIRYEGGTHYQDGRDFDGWFCVAIRKDRRNVMYKYENEVFSKER